MLGVIHVMKREAFENHEVRKVVVAQPMSVVLIKILGLGDTGVEFSQSGMNKLCIYGDLAAGNKPKL